MRVRDIDSVTPSEENLTHSMSFKTVELEPQDQAKFLAHQKKLNELVEAAKLDLGREIDSLKSYTSPRLKQPNNVHGIDPNNELAKKYHSVLEKSQQANEQILSAQNKYLIQAEMMNNHDIDTIYEISQSNGVRKSFAQEYEMITPPLGIRSAQNIAFHLALKTYDDHPQWYYQLLHSIKTFWSFIRRDKSSKEMYAALLISRLRKDTREERDILKEAAVEEIFLSLLENGKVSDDHLLLLDIMSHHVALAGDKQHIKDLAKAFMIRQLDPKTFLLQKLAWIQQIYDSFFDVGNSFKGSEVLQDSWESINHLIHQNIERLDNFLMSVYLHKPLGLDDYNFFFENIDQDLWLVRTRGQGIVHNKRYNKIANELLAQWKDTVTDTVRMAVSLPSLEGTLKPGLVGSSLWNKSELMIANGMDSCATFLEKFRILRSTNSGPFFVCPICATEKDSKIAMCRTSKLCPLVNNHSQKMDGDIISDSSIRPEFPDQHKMIMYQKRFQQLMEGIERFHQRFSEQLQELQDHF